jgi:8-hydroxy-5-deazaflavin:NADPH oxidoreductase
MRIVILGGGPSAEPLARLAERAGYTVRWLNDVRSPSGKEAADVCILAGSRAQIETLLVIAALPSMRDTVVVDATIPTVDDRAVEETDTAQAGTDWITTKLSHAHIVRAFNSVPAEALTRVLNDPSADGSERLAVPLAGDDRGAKAVVAQFMRGIGVEPFDLGGLSSGDVLEPGGALWQKALTSVEMLEAVGWLSGDG